MTFRKQAIGIDISKATLSVCLGSITQNGTIKYSPNAVFENSKPGFNKLLRWAKPMLDSDSELVFLMEATGVYPPRSFKFVT